MLGVELVRASALHLARVLPRFDAGRFVRQACDGLEALEAKARALRVKHTLTQRRVLLGHAGRHGVVVPINGKAVAGSSFGLAIHDLTSR